MNELLEDIKFELGIDEDDDSQDKLIQRFIGKAENSIRSYCNNPELDFTDGLLDDVIAYIVSMRLNPDTKFGNSAGKSNDRGMLTTIFLSDYPDFIKNALKPHKKNPKAKFK